MSKKFLLFDIDGTLVHAGGAGRRALLRALAEAGCAPRSLEQYSFAGKTDRQIVLAALRQAAFAAAEMPELLERVLASYLAYLEAELGRSPARAYPLAHELLQACSGRDDLELALLTGNVPAGARLKLTSAGLWRHFSWGVFGDHSEERADLAREAWRLIRCRDNGVVARDIFVIGDTTADIACGQAIGAFTVAVASGFEPREKLAAAAPDLLADGFAPLFDLWRLDPMDTKKVKGKRKK